jgi:hypothetical protein
MPAGVKSTDALGAAGANIPDEGTARIAVGQSGARKIASAQAPAHAHKEMIRLSIPFEDTRE